MHILMAFVVPLREAVVMYHCLGNKNGQYFCVIHFCVIHPIFKEIDEVTQSVIQNLAVTYSVILAVIYSVILFFQ